MAKITKTAKLAHVHLTPAEVEKFDPQLDAVFGYMDILNEVNTDDVEPTSQVTGLTNVMREDEIEDFCTKAELLEQSPLPVERGQIKVKKVL